MEFSRQEYWSGLLFPSPGDLPDPGIEPGSPILQADTLLSEPLGIAGNWIFLNIISFEMNNIMNLLSLYQEYVSEK